MPEIELPYGKKKLTVEIAEKNLLGILESHAADCSAAGTETAIVKEALANPLDSESLAELARNQDKIVLITSDHTRPVPSSITMPLLLAEIRKGNPAADISILIATGFHRASTEEELRAKFGDQIVDQEKIVIHDCRDQDSMVKVGVLPSGGDLLLNKLAMEADLLLAEGFIEPHFFAGYSGGRKSILPGIASKKTVLANHCAEFIAHEKSRTGSLEGNPMHQDMLFAAEQAGLAFILNVVIDADKKIIKAFAGDQELAHRQGCEFVSRLAGVEAKPADIVLTTNGGYPLDQNIYQSVKGMTAAEASCKEGGVIIIAAQCADGHGGDVFYNTFAGADTVQEVMDGIMARGRNETVPDQWESQILARILLKYQVIMVTDAPREMVEAMHLRWAANLTDAIVLAQEILANDQPTITVIPDGVSVIVS